MRGLELIIESQGLEKNCTRWRKQTYRQVTDMATLWLNRPSGADLEKKYQKVQ